MSEVQSAEYRSKALDYYGDECKNCGKKGNVEVHHIDCNRNNNVLCNLVPLCRECHMKVHNDRLDCSGYLAELARQVPVEVPNRVYIAAECVADKNDYSMKEAIRHMVREGGYDV